MGIMLRLISSAYVLWTIAAQQWGDLFQCVVLAALCFGVAAGLDRLEQLDQRTRRHSSALAKMLGIEDKSTGLNEELAPHAPRNWMEFKPRPPEDKRDSFLQQRIAQRWRHVERPKKKIKG